MDGVGKGALEVYTASFANELRSKKIRVSSVGISADTYLYQNHALQKANYEYIRTLERIDNKYISPASHSVDPIFLATEASKFIVWQHIEAIGLEIPLD